MKDAAVILLLILGALFGLGSVGMVVCAGWPALRQRLSSKAPDLLKGEWLDFGPRRGGGR